MPLDRSIGNYFDSSTSFLRRVARWTGPNPYVTGGEPITAGLFGLGRIVAALYGLAVDAGGTTAHQLVFNPATQKLMWFDATPSGYREITNGTDLSMFSAPFEVIGQ